MRINIKIKLAMVLSVLILMSTSFLAIVIINHQKMSLEIQMRNMASTLTDELANDSKMALLEGDHLSLNLTIQNVIRYPGVVNAYILDKSLSIEGHADLSEVGTPYYGDPKTILNAKDTRPWLIEEDSDTLSFATPIIFRETIVGYAVIVFSKDFVRQEVKKTIKKSTLIALLVITVVAFFSIPMASSLLRPLYRLIEGTHEIARGSLGYRIPYDKRKDEIGDLINSFNYMAEELEKKEVLKGAFNRYVSTHIADEILKKPENVRLGGEKRDITVLFGDIRGFTALTRQMQPEEIVELLNSHFTMLTEIIFNFGGTVDKFMGDAIMGLFGSPIHTEDHTEQGIKAVFCINEILSLVNKTRERGGRVPLPMGIGLDSGLVILGNMGSKVRMEYTAIGDTVNIASRLAGLAKGGEILISEAIYETVKPNIVTEQIPLVEVKGVEEPLVIYRLVGLCHGWKEDVEDAVHRISVELRKEGIIV